MFESIPPLVSLTISGLLTLGIFSFLYKDNPVYKTCEAIFVGVSAAYWSIEYFFSNLHRKFWDGVFPPAGSEADPWLWGGAILGALMLFRLSAKAGWISRWPLSFIVGATAGLYMITFFVTKGMKQVADTMLTLIQFDKSGAFMVGDSIGAIVVAIGVVSGLIYFFFSKEHKGSFGGAAKVGIWFLMITFGASFGYTVMSRMSLLIGRMEFILGTWLKLLG
ncbi:MAG: hypothetical protein ACE5GA_08745 [Candidatus Zixiibacteriota bacterium]